MASTKNENPAAPGGATTKSAAPVRDLMADLIESIEVARGSRFRKPPAEDPRS